MSTERKAIRKKLVEVLRYQTDAGENVHANRAVRQWQENLPAVMIYLRSETVEGEWSQAPRILKRGLQVVIEIQAADPLDPSDTLDDISEQIEQIIAQDDTLGCTVEDIKLSAVDTEFEDNGSQVVGATRLVFDAVYLKEMPKDRTNQGADQDAKTFQAGWQLDDDSELEAEDIITLGS